MEAMTLPATEELRVYEEEFLNSDIAEFKRLTSCLQLEHIRI
jgi:hypothetical protein